LSPSRFQAAFLVAVASAALSNCGKGSSNPVAAVTPTPTAVPTAVPTATAFVCPLGKGTGDGRGGEPGAGPNEDCKLTKKADPFQFKAVADAVIYVEGLHPDWIYQESNGVVRLHNEDREAFFQDVVDRLNTQGFCSIDDAHGVEGDGLEIAVKYTNDFSEQYKFWTTGSPNGKKDGIIRLDYTMHVATCTPAWF
jgi:hypothetical protein